ncbi:MAG: outer membrane protein transport protein [Geminicoccaceae bacterium]
MVRDTILKTRLSVATTLSIAVSTVSAPDARAAGFALKEQSATAQGNAFAGAATEAADASYMFFNPAALGRLERMEATASVTYISPTSKLKRANASSATGVPFTGSGDANDIGEGGMIPALYGVAPLNDDWRIGIAITAPFGLKTEYDGGWVGRYHGVMSELQSVNINPVVSYNPTPWLSVAGGLQVQYMKAKLTNAVDFGTISGLGAGAFDGFADLKGDDIAYGYNLGAIAEPVEGSRFGIAYRSSVNHTLRGDVDFDVPAVLQPALGATFAHTNIDADFKSPASVTMGIAQDVTDKLTLMAGATWTKWSNFDELRIEFQSDLPDNVTEEKWDDQWSFAVGATYKANDQLTLRAGGAFDQKALDTEYRTPRIPDNDRFWLSTGMSYDYTDSVSVSLGYTHIFVQDANIRLKATDPGNGTRGNLDARYDSDIDLIALSGTFRF